MPAIHHVSGKQSLSCVRLLKRPTSSSLLPESVLENHTSASRGSAIGGTARADEDVGYQAVDEAGDDDDDDGSLGIHDGAASCACHKAGQGDIANDRHVMSSDHTQTQ